VIKHVVIVSGEQQRGVNILIFTVLILDVGAGR